MTVTTVDHRRITSSDPYDDGPPRCVCGAYYPCDAVRERIRSEHEEMMAARSEHARSVEANRVGVAVLVEVGCEIWSSERRREDHGELVPIGGVVVAITELERDADSGFIPRRFVTIDPTQRPDQWEHTLEEGEVDFGLTVAANAGRLVTLITRLQEAGSRRKGRILTPRDGRFIEYERALKAVILP